jgi:MICOS complex subunit MIC12
LNFQLGGFTLSVSLLYISIQVHRSNRIRQRNAIREQTAIINGLASPAGAYYREFASPIKASRQDPASSEAPIAPTEKQPSKEDYLKHQWNKEIERLALKAFAFKWENVRDTATDGYETVSRLIKKG